MGLVLTVAAQSGGRPYHAALVPIRTGPGINVPLHRHADYHELMYVVRGQGVHRLHDHNDHLGVGDLVLVRKGIWHGIMTRSGGGMDFINVAFSTASWRDFVRAAQIGAAAGWQADRRPVGVRLAGGGAVRAEQAFRATLSRYHRAPSRLDLVRLWTEVVPLLTREPAPGPRPEPAWLRTACRRMTDEANLQEGLPRLLVLAAVSHGHLARSMRAYYGLTPVAFLTNIRLDHATMLLGTTTLGISTISARCGFSSHSYFTARFQARYGLSPREFRCRAQSVAVPDQHR